MPRKNLIRSDYHPYHVTARVNNRENFPLPLAEVWEMINLEVFSAHIRFGIEVQNLVLMPNHFHMILTTPELDLGIAMQVVMRNITKRSHQRTRKSGHLFGGPYHWSLIKSGDYYFHAFKYVYRNPVRANLCRAVENYPFSTVSGLLGFNPLHIPIFHTRAGFEYYFPDHEPVKCLPWLNQPQKKSSENFIRVGLKKNVFSPPLNLETGQAEVICD